MDLVETYKTEVFDLGLFLCTCECQHVTLCIVPYICVQQLLQHDALKLQLPVLQKNSVYKLK